MLVDGGAREMLQLPLDHDGNGRDLPDLRWITSPASAHVDSDAQDRRIIIDALITAPLAAHPQTFICDSHGKPSEEQLSTSHIPTSPTLCKNLPLVSPLVIAPPSRG